MAPASHRFAMLPLALIIACAFVPTSSRAADAERRLVVGGDCDYPPYEFLDRDGRPAGYNVDLTRAVAEVMGMKVEFRLGAWAEVVSALRDGQVDLLPGMSYSDERAGQFGLSPPHTVVSHAIFARTGARRVGTLEELRGNKVALHRDGIMDETLTRAGQGDDLIRTPTPADALRLVASGGCDYAVVAIVPGTYITRELGLTNVLPVARNVAAQRYGYAVRLGDTALLARITEGLAILKATGRYDAIREKWLGVLEPRPVSWRMFLQYGAVVFVPLLFGLGGALAWSRSLSRQVAQRTASLRLEVAERQRAVEEVRLNHAQLVQADKMAALGVLVSGVAHEINNPNGYLLLNMPIVKDVLLDSMEMFEERFEREGNFTIGGLPYDTVRQELPPMLDEMIEGSRRIKRIVEDLKEFARRDDAPRLEPVDLSIVVRAAVRLVENPIRKHTTRFELACADGLPRILGNSQRIEQVVVNLILNACQALPDPGHGIRVVTRADPEHRTVVLEVDDEGVGIRPEDLSRLTDPFFTTKRDTGGTGLGLSVSAGIVKEHGGSLEFRSALGAGTSVVLTLPAIQEKGA